LRQQGPEEPRASANAAVDSAAAQPSAAEWGAVRASAAAAPLAVKAATWTAHPPQPSQLVQAVLGGGMPAPASTLPDPADVQLIRHTLANTQRSLETQMGAAASNYMVATAHSILDRCKASPPGRPMPVAAALLSVACALVAPTFPLGISRPFTDPESSSQVWRGWCQGLAGAGNI
jgi:hypothetical protein